MDVDSFAAPNELFMTKPHQSLAFPLLCHAANRAIGSDNAKGATNRLTYEAFLADYNRGKLAAGPADDIREMTISSHDYGHSNG